ncbi:hypothetical protein [Desulfopila inferna]|uniref:hypothetical protein n=1 Tax=Desulfopila inferna TaxID=468528 RepID=UPI0019626DB1|nr:hypothetical protein [Desulfopila inferna]MBM9604970.1 hypothetical protein [Desulfopila inferna]
MKKLIGMFGALIVAVLLVYSVNVTAPPAPDPPPPPPPPANECTPGYWKNHTEVWFGEQCGGDTFSDAVLLDMLSPEDGGLGRVKENRELAAYLLNTCEAVVPNCE